MAPRAKKVEEEIIETEVSVTGTEEKAVYKENDQLRNEVDTLKAMVNQLMSQMASNNQAQAQTQTVTDDSEISPNKYVKVMSLRNHKLNLSTEGFGQGNKHPFTKFGQIKSIPYSDVSAIINAEESFHRKGAFYILDEQVVKRHGLEELQNSILDKDQMLEIFDMGTNEISEVFGSASEMQKETIVSLLLERAKAGEEPDYNKLKVMSKIYGKDIAEMVEQIINPVEQS